jgi:hypothetical protein
MHRPPAHHPAPPMNTATARGARADQRRLSGDQHHEHARTSGVMTCPDARTRSTLSKIAGVLHFVTDADDVYEIVTRLKAAMAPGSYPVVSHVTGDDLPAEATASARELLFLASDLRLVLIRVWDGNSQLPTRRDAQPDDDSGRGLMLAECLASEWGVYEKAHGKVVWALLEALYEPMQHSLSVR